MEELKDNYKKLKKIIIVAGILNIIGLIFINVTILKLTPLTLVSSITVGGALILISIILYLYAVINELRTQKIL
ncbi:MAG: hypothetical protein ACRENZ_02905 [Thermodesulfobacteriota bacterium]